MPDYNIIYTSLDDEPYLWNGSGFDLLRKEENEKLLFSGKTFESKELPAALKKSRAAAKKIFPADSAPKIKEVKVPVNNKSNAAGHSPHIIS